MSETDWTGLAAALVERVAAAGYLGAGWGDAFAATPRHLFVPDHPLADAYSGAALITQTRQTPPDGDESTTVDLPTSSMSDAGAVAVMLDRLHVAEGSRVLEIGTGTGYNAALLCHRLGGHNVYSVDIDPALVESARTRLADLGHRPTLAAGDGYGGLPAGAPYDRIISTAAINHVPPEWIRQLAAGGRLVAPLDSPADGALGVFDKTADDEVTGRIDPQHVYFMPLRPDAGSPLGRGRPTWNYCGPLMAHHGPTSLDPRVLVDADADLAWFLHLHIPGLSTITANDGPNGPAVFVSAGGDAFAVAGLATGDGGTWPVEQRGSRRLWDTVEHVVPLFDALGRPDRSRFGISALDDTDRQYVWLDDPLGPLSWPMPL